jgi:DNA-binding FrmR family transcriptional regulator
VVPLAIDSAWYIGWGLGALVVVVAAALLLIIIVLARRIAGQADAITEALDGARQNTTGLFDVASANHAIDRITRGLRAVRTGEPEKDPTERTEPLGAQRGPVSALRDMWEERRRQ